MVRTLIVTLIFAAGLSAGEAYAADSCVDTSNPWTCFGVMELKMPLGGQVRIARMIRYTNGEIMFEIESAGGTQRALVVLPAGIEFFSGLQSKQDIDIGKNPFTLIDQGFNAVIALLQRSFPGGPLAASENSDATVPLEGDASAHVTLQRIDAQSLRYQAEVTGARQFTASGMFKQGLVPPLPKDFSLKEWLSKEEGIKTLGAARAKKKEAEPKKK